MMFIARLRKITNRMLCVLTAAAILSIPFTGQTIYASEIGNGRTPLFITEIMYDAPGNDDGAEYIEISNASDHALDISGYYLGDAAVQGSSEGMFRFPEGSVIGAWESIVIA
ncbi:lamin tail domain-containing protein [Paenibacillus sp. J2TS4]|uniref:lamin tail domain-containing protein n=1 Tax=Paenibacillus sp. J2TS4 TaxID=2807194 RepID=UPI001B1E7A54|nr:lamin tail domain-containing protein [Paenibacillus sp. J2TS4]GIP36666.1 hypothetical protein J2TS4_58760 [Paenibacillus sp. J2TS4]